VKPIHCRCGDEVVIKLVKGQWFIDYANSHGARIINMSFGGPGFSQSVKDAIDASPALCVCAAGNSGANNDQAPLYPASLRSDNIIAVAATDQNGQCSLFSSTGPAVELAARV
jgi:subtilisin family serine protease